MFGKVRAVPEGFHTLTPQLVVHDAAAAIDYYRRTFGATVRRIHRAPGGAAITHAELKIGNSVLIVRDEFPGMHALSPQSLGGTTAAVHVYVEDVDAVFQRALAAGAKILVPLNDAFWGDRYGVIVDPFGQHWSLATHTQDLSPEEIRKAADEAIAQVVPES